MERYAVYDLDNGYILTVGSGPAGIADRQEGLWPNSGIIIDSARISSDYIDLSGAEPVIVPRPSAAHGWSEAGVAPVTLGMGSLPAGSGVTATNEAGESVTTDDPADPIILADPETYTVTISPPWPYLPETLTIEVT